MATHTASRRAPRLVGRWLQSLLAIWLLLGVSLSAWAQGCPPVMTATIASGGTAEFIVTPCAPVGMDVPNPITSPQHGSLEQGTPTNIYTVVYTNNGDGASADSFQLRNWADNAVTTFNVTIGPASSLTVSPATLPTPTIGVAYSQSLSTTGGTAPYTYSLGGGAIPPGLSLSASGVISGIPTQADSHSFTINVSDSAGASGVKSYSVNIPGPALDISPDSVPTGFETGAYNVTLTGSGGTAPYDFRVNNGALPPGLSLSSSGAITGTPTPGSAGSYTAEIELDDSTTGSAGGNYFILQDFTFVIQAAPTITVNPATLPNATAGTSYSQTMTASGGTAPYTFAVTTGSLPAGLSLAANGSLTGTPTAGGSFPVTVTATDSNGFPGARNYTLTVDPADIVLPSTVPAAQVGAAYSASVAASGGTAPYGYTITAGALPAGLTLNAGSGAITGTPSAGGSFNFTVRAIDSSSGTGAPYSDSLAYTLAVAAPTITIAPATLPDGTSGMAYSQTISASGGTAPYSFAVTAGALPAGLSLNAGTGTITGTPTASGTFNFTVTATDSSTGAGPYGQPRAYALTVASAAPIAGPVSATVAYGSGANPITLNLSGGTANSVAVASPPTHGAALASGITITYQPDAGYVGPDSFTYTATNADGTSAPATVAITVSPPTLTLSPAAGTLNASYGVAYSQTFGASGGAAPYGYAVSTGTLPPGLALDAASGVVSGTPTAPGSYPVTITATDSSTGAGAPFTVANNYIFDVAVPTVTLAPATLPDGAAGSAYGQAISASGGVGPYTLAVTAGALPTGMSLASDGTLSGTPTASGVFNVTVTATDANSQTGSRAYTLTIAAATLDVTPATVPAGTIGVAYSQSFTTTGGVTPYGYALGSGALPPGMTLSAGGVLSGTPTATGAFAFDLQVTDSSGGTPATGTVSYTLVVDAPTITLAPPTLPNAVVGTAYTQTLVASGGTAPYAFSVTGGSLPAGLSLAGDGVLTGTPTASGTSAFTVQARGAYNQTGSHNYTVTVAEAVPVAVDDAASTVAEQAVRIAVTDNDSGVIDAIAIATQPAHGTVGIDALEAVYTPAAGFSGSDSFTYTANGPGGVSTAATVAIEVSPLPVPVGKPQSLNVLAGQTLSFDAAAGASGEPFTGVSVVEPPAAGEVAVDDTRIDYTPPATAHGTVTITYTISNAYGASDPVTSTITIDPLPIAVAHRAQVLAGGSVEVELTEGATGGPFTGAEVLTIAPVEAGSASVARIGDGDDAGYRLTFTADDGYAGNAAVRYTLSNAHATSVPATVTIEIAARPDPARDAEVTGLLRAQVESVRRLAEGQIGNFQGRLERLHGDRGGANGFDNGLSVAIDRSCAEHDWQVVGSVCPQPLGDEQAAVRAPVESAATRNASMSRSSTSRFAIWTAGAMRFGDYDPRRGASGFEFETSGLSVGADYRLGPAFALGAGFGYGRDISDIGEHDSRSEAEAWSGAVYASYHPGEHVYLDGLLGYQRLSFDLRRYVTANGASVAGDRDGRQWFVSLAAGYQWQREQLQLTPYARIDHARAALDGYVEQGDPLYALAFERQDIDTTTTSLGLRADYFHELDWGTFAPQLRLEYQHDLDADSVAAMRYADLPLGPFYRAGIDGFDRNRFELGLGAAWQTRHRFGVRLEYLHMLGNNGADDQSLRLELEKQF